MTDDSASSRRSSAQTQKTKSNLIVLVGFMGAGKTTVGQALARRLHAQFLDLDDLIQAHDGRTIPEIFEQSGETAFRAIEQQVLRKIALSPPLMTTVLSLGGGAFIDNTNRELLRENKVHTVFLDAPAEELFRRCAQPEVIRPLLGEREHFDQLLEARRPTYLKASLCVQTADRDIVSIAEEIILRLGLI